VMVALAAIVVPVDPAHAADVRKAQWHLDYLKIEEAQRISSGLGVTVAVVDTGVHAEHADLRGQVVSGVDLVDAGGNGHRDTASHGTGVAGLIVAKGGGSTHAYGVAPGARVLPVRASEGGRTTGSRYRAVRAAADSGAKVINLSYSGTGPPSFEEREAIAYALSKDAVVVAGAGNIDGGQTSIGAPASIPGVIAVTGFDQRGTFWSGSVQGPEAVLAAPAKDVVTTAAPAGGPTGYSLTQGTSSATAIVSGVVAMVRAKYPDLDAANVINRLIRTADDAGPPGRDPQYGFGRINPVRALTADVAPVTQNPLGVPTGAPAGSASGSSNAPGAGKSPSGGQAVNGGANGGANENLRTRVVAALAVVLVLVVGFVVLAIALLRLRSRGRSSPRR